MDTLEAHLNPHPPHPRRSDPLRSDCLRSDPHRSDPHCFRQTFHRYHQSTSHLQWEHFQPVTDFIS